MYRLLIVLFLLLLAGCVSEPYSQNSALPDRSADKYQYQLYGKLEERNGRYLFTQFSEEYDRHSPWVRLSDMRPMWNVHTEDCLSGVDVAGLKRQCKSQNPDLFRVKQTDFTAKKSAGYVVLTAFTLGFGAASPPAAVKFDEENFIAAVNEATREMNGILRPFDYIYPKILSDYDEEKINFDKIYRDLVSGYKPQAKPRIRLNDLSGLSNKRAEDFVNHISIKPNTVMSLKDIKALKANELSNLLFLVRNQNSKALTMLQKQVTFFNVHCDKKIVLKIEYQLDCPQRVSANAQYFDVQVDIKSVTYDNVLPKYLVTEDEFLSVQLKGGKFVFSNKSSSYITIDSLSFYHNGKIANTSNLKYELAPGSQTTQAGSIGISSINLDKHAIQFRNITEEFAKQTQVEYGVALKYRIIDIDREKTLLRKKRFLLSELI